MIDVSKLKTGDRIQRKQDAPKGGMWGTVNKIGEGSSAFDFSVILDDGSDFNLGLRGNWYSEILREPLFVVDNSLPKKDVSADIASLSAILRDLSELLPRTSGDVHIAVGETIINITKLMNDTIKGAYQ